jgi:hypothetical protein
VSYFVTGHPDFSIVRVRVFGRETSANPELGLRGHSMLLDLPSWLLMRTAEKLPDNGRNSIMGERGGKVTHYN